MRRERGAKEIKGGMEEGERACNEEKDGERSSRVCMSQKLPPLVLWDIKESDV